MIPRKYRIHAILIVTFLVIIFYPQYHNKPDKSKTTAATAAALKFLQLVDSGQVDKSWHDSAKYLQKTVPLADWKKKLAMMRAVYGPDVKRKLTDASFTAPTKDLPDSEIILLTFSSEFKNQPVATETVTLLLVGHSSWQVVGYFIK